MPSPAGNSIIGRRNVKQTGPQKREDVQVQDDQRECAGVLAASGHRGCRSGDAQRHGADD